MTELLAELQRIARVLAARPDDRDALWGMARIGRELGDAACEEQALRWLLQYHPGARDGWLSLAAALRRQRRGDEAARVADAALARWPDEPRLHLERALADEAAGRPAATRAALDALVAARPEAVRAHLERLYFLRRQGDRVAALAAAEALIALAPDEPLGWVGRATELHNLDRFAEAGDICRQALRRWPDCAPLHVVHAHNLLRLGDWRQGFREFEWRLRLPDAPPPPLPLPRASADDPPGTRVLVWSDQGLGDVIQALRFLPWLRERGLVPLLHLPRSLARLARMMPDPAPVGVAGEPPLPADRQIAVGSLPLLCGVERAEGTWRGVYLNPPPDLPALTEDGAGLRVGVVWGGSPLHDNDRFRSIALAELAPLFAVPGVRWHSLQLGRPQDRPPAGVVDLAPRLTDFAATAGLLAQFDVLVTVDTSIAHLAGGLGVPTWLLLCHRIDWRWTPGDGATGWYPSLRLFRQQHYGDWSDPVAAVGQRLAELSAAKTAGG
jgi:tetratricopeptide (TPR) repeat protein